MRTLGFIAIGRDGAGICLRTARFTPTRVKAALQSMAS